MATALQDLPPFAGHSPEQERPLGAYGLLMTTFGAATGGFALWLRRSGRPLPERVDVGDIVLLSIATHKSARLIARDRVAGTIRAPFTRFQNDAGHAEVNEQARGHGLRRAIGELLICPYCLGMWIATAFLAGLLVAPRATRWIASSFVVLTGSDLLQIAYARAEQLL